MPVILRVRGYRFWFYEADLAEPPHVHVGKDGKEAKYWLTPIALASVRRFRDHELHEIERILEEHQDDMLKSGEKSNGNAATPKARIKTHENYSAIVPLTIPDLDEVREFAAKLHAQGKAWKGEAFGWQAEYNPQRSKPPLDSKMTFTPADFCIGESGIWFFALMWERGRHAEPVEFLDDKNILKKTGRHRRIRE